MGLGHVFGVVSFITVMTTGVTEEDRGVVGGLSQLPRYVAAIGVSGLSAIAAARTDALSSGAVPSRADILGGRPARRHGHRRCRRPRRRPARRRRTGQADHGPGVLTRSVVDSADGVGRVRGAPSAAAHRRPGYSGFTAEACCCGSACRGSTGFGSQATVVRR
ncbi:hypothetical protein PYK79_25405 [Streptomyces sp. ID05-04B]|nr:hypothetical protein [Streptomyces sp. ID05-04B]